MGHKNQAVQLENMKARIDKVHIDGLQRTKDDYIVSAFNDLFKVNTFQDLLEQTVETRLKLEKLGCFKNVSIVIDTSKGAKATPEFGYDITFNVVELNRFTGRMDTAIENNQGSIGLAVQTPNLGGRGEILRSEVKCSSKKMPNFNTSFIKPLKVCDGSFSSTLFKQNSENGASGYKISEYGTLFGVAFLYRETVSHKIEYEGAVRNVSMLNRNVAFDIREASGYSLKSSIKNTLNVDSRDCIIFPTSGGLVQLKSELAGLGGNIGFLKNELVSQINCPLISNISLQGSFAAGAITDTTKSKYYSLVDRFFIGGPLTLRGFEFNTVGPKADGLSTGGSLYWTSALHLYTPLPHMPKKGSFGDHFRIHFFGNAGNLSQTCDSLKGCFEKMSENIRLTYGFGLVYRLGQLARIELNYCIPFLHQNDDKLIDGVQFGIGVHFL